MIIIETLLMGTFATFVMDFFAGLLAKRKFIYPFVTPEAIGRWFDTGLVYNCKTPYQGVYISQGQEGTGFLRLKTIPGVSCY